MNPTQSQTDGKLYLPDLLHALQTGVGTRPRPVQAGGDAMRPAPVLVSLSALTGSPPDREGEPDPSGCMLIDVTHFQFQSQTAEHPARLVLFVTLPDPFRVVDPATHAVTPLAEEVEATEGETVVGDEPYSLPPELAHLDPAVYSVNTDKPAGYSSQRERVPNQADLKAGG